MAQVARMRAEVKEMLNTTLGHYGDVYRTTVRYVIAGTFDECAQEELIARYMIGGIKLSDRIVSAEQYEAEAARRTLVTVTDETVRKLADGMKARTVSRNGREYTRTVAGLGIAPWLQRTMGLRIREALGVRKADFMERADGTRYLHLCWQASEDGRTLEPLKHRKTGDYRDVPVPDMVWNMVQARPDGPVCPGPSTPYMSYSTAQGRFSRITQALGIIGMHTHSLRHLLSA